MLDSAEAAVGRDEAPGEEPGAGIGEWGTVPLVRARFRVCSGAGDAKAAGGTRVTRTPASEKADKGDDAPGVGEDSARTT